MRCKSIAEIETALMDFARSELLAEGLEFGPSDSLQELGVESFALMELLLFVERFLECKLPAETLRQENLLSISALARFAHNFVGSLPTHGAQ